MKLLLAVSLTMSTLLGQAPLDPKARAVPPQSTVYIPKCEDYRLWYEQSRTFQYDAVRQSYHFSDLKVTTWPDRKLLTPDELMALLESHRKELGIDDISLQVSGDSKIQLGELMYPQSYKNYTLSQDEFRELQRRAKESLATSRYAHADVIAHWRSILAGTPPFGLKVR